MGVIRGLSSFSAAKTPVSGREREKSTFYSSKGCSWLDIKRINLLRQLIFILQLFPSDSGTVMTLWVCKSLSSSLGSTHAGSPPPPPLCVPLASACSSDPAYRILSIQESLKSHPWGGQTETNPSELRKGTDDPPRPVVPTPSLLSLALHHVVNHLP